MATFLWAEGMWMGRWSKANQKRGGKLFLLHGHVKQVRGPAGAVMCESRDLGIKWPQWPQWHTFLLEGQVAADMRAVRPQDVKKMHLKQDRMVCWKRWAAKHECEELKAAETDQLIVDG